MQQERSSAGTSTTTLPASLTHARATQLEIESRQPRVNLLKLTAIQSGDVLQFCDYERAIQKSAEKKVLLPDGTPLTYSSSTTDVLKRPHHTAVANSVASSDSVNVLEQNVDRGGGKLEKTGATASIALSTRSAVTTASTER